MKNRRVSKGTCRYFSGSRRDAMQGRSTDVPGAKLGDESRVPESFPLGNRAKVERSAEISKNYSSQRVCVADF